MRRDLVKFAEKEGLVPADPEAFYAVKTGKKKDTSGQQQQQQQGQGEQD